ncbi:hypothetical protein Tco_0963737 [Tanacetum coccineum]
MVGRAVDFQEEYRSIGEWQGTITITMEDDKPKSGECLEQVSLPWNLKRHTRTSLLAYDIAAIEYRGVNAVTKFDLILTSDV